eukprot:jgi/Orpsp1_1/1187240/evm.model.d7180000056286.1
MGIDIVDMTAEAEGDSTTGGETDQSDIFWIINLQHGLIRFEHHSIGILYAMICAERVVRKPNVSSTAFTVFFSAFDGAITTTTNEATTEEKEDSFFLRFLLLLHS